MQLPLFPLHTVLFPDGRLSLRIFEARYLDMVSACLRTDTGFGVCLINEGREVGPSPTIFGVGTLARIIDWEQREGGLLGITVQGEQRFRVQQTQEQPDQLLIGEVEVLPHEAEVALPEEFLSLSALLRRIVDELGAPYDGMPSHYDRAGWVGARLTELLPLEPEVKHALLELDDPLVRLFRLRDAMLNMNIA